MRHRRSLPFGVGLISAGLVLALARPATTAAQSWAVAPASNPHHTGTFQHPALTESSGVAVSRRQPGVLWTFNDSGNPPWLFATDTLGRDRGTFLVRGARNDDWEAIALGSCGKVDCLYLADTGDNFQQRRSSRLYRVPEPAVTQGGDRLQPTAAAEVLTLQYPNGPTDVEALFVDPAGDAYLVSKGWGGSAELFRVPAVAWSSHQRVVAEALGPLPIATGREAGRLVTDAALSTDGLVAVRTYREVFLFRLAGRRLVPEAGRACDLGRLDLLGEGVAWLDQGTLVLTSEGALGVRGTISVAGCPGR